MSLVKGFLRPKFRNNIATNKYIVGVIVGLLMAFFLYALQYMTREMMRVSSISEDDIWILSETEVSFYNLTFAFIAVIVGQSFCLEYWFNRPKNNFKARPGRWSTVVHEQRFMNWYFLAWFSKLATMYGLLFCTSGLGHFYLMSFFPEYNYMFVLMIIVLFLQPWNGLLLTFKKRALKWMGASLVAVSILSFGLSKIDIVDYKTLNQNVLNRKLDVKYNLSLPKSKIYEDKFRRFRNIPNISIVTSKNSDKSLPLLFVGQIQIDKEKLPEKMLQIRSKQHAELQNFMPAFLRIDKEVPMSFVHEIKRELTFVNLHLINYLVIPEDAAYDEKYYTGWNRVYLSRMNTDYFAPDDDEYLFKARAVSNRIEISISNKGYEINGSVIPKKDLVALLKKRLTQDLDYAIVLTFKEDINYGTYFGMISKVNEAIYVIRDEMAFKGYGMDFKTLEEKYRYGGEGISRENIRAIQAKYPMKYVENWDESGIKLPKKNQPDFALPEIK